MDRNRIRLYPRGIDTELYHPSRRNGFYKTYGLGESELKILYVGRVSREKDLPLLTEVFKRLTSEGLAARLVVIGDGPYLREMKTELADLPATFTGFLSSEDLAEAYASADLLSFPRRRIPSETWSWRPRPRACPWWSRTRAAPARTCGRTRPALWSRAAMTADSSGP